MKPSIAKNLTFAVGALNFVCAIVPALERRNLPRAGFWDHREWILTLAVIITAMVPLTMGWLRERGEKKNAHRATEDAKTREILTTALVYASDHTNLNCTKIGFHVFKVRERRLFQKRWPFIRKALDHEGVTSLRLASSPPPSGISWTEGKGVIGRCAATRTTEIIDVRDHFRPNWDKTKAEWDELPADARLGLVYEEFRRTREYFGVVGATPIFSRTSPYGYVGCVSVDTPYDAGPIDSTALNDSLRTAARILEVKGFP